MPPGTISIQTGDGTGADLEHAQFSIDRRTLLNIIGVAQVSTTKSDRCQENGATEMRQVLTRAVGRSLEEGLGAEVARRVLSQAGTNAEAQRELDGVEQSLRRLLKNIADVAGREEKRIESELRDLNVSLTSLRETRKEALPEIDNMQESLGPLHGEEDLAKLGREVTSVEGKTSKHGNCVQSMEDNNLKRRPVL
jgi:hypothetical protein